MRSNHSYLFQYQTTAFQFLLIICIASDVMFLLSNFYKNLLLLPLLQVVFVVFSGLILLLLLKGKLDRYLYKVCLVYLAVLYCFLIFTLLMVPSVETTIFSVIFLIPPASYLLLGQRWGFIYTAFFSLIILVLYFFRLSFDTGSFNLGGLGNLVLCLAAVWLFSNLYEKSRIQSREFLIKTASEDDLTKLLSRSSLHVILIRDLQSSVGEDKSLSIVIMDIDWFQIINDNYGHKLGDKTLIEVANIIKQSIRHSDSAFRLGGQDFCVSLPSTTAKEAYWVAEKIRTEIEQKVFRFENTVISLTISAGIVDCYSKDCVVDKLLKKAYKRMHAAKSAGRNRIIMDDVQ